MALNVIEKVFGSKSERDVKKLHPVVEQINEIFETLRDKPDDRPRYL
jgi:preprotein translocase subunit SecA